MNIVSTPISETKAKVLASYTDDTLITNVAINTLPASDAQVGKKSELFINPTTGELFYEYTDKPLTETEQVLSDRLAQTEEQNAQMLLALVAGGLM